METNPHRWFGVGHSRVPGSAKAGAEAAAEAIGGRTPKAVFVFCSVAHDLPVLLAAVRAEAGRDAVIVGTTTIGELFGDGAGDGGVVIAALGGDGRPCASAIRLFWGRQPGKRCAGSRFGCPLTIVGCGMPSFAAEWVSPAALR